ncbi:MAG TPA: hypothetical protein VEA35_03310, partial [Ramlibacter sp.]|nr:hypothetical protein [Ramlibacter sp.]
GYRVAPATPAPRVVAPAQPAVMVTTTPVTSSMGAAPQALPRLGTTVPAAAPPVQQQPSAGAQPGSQYRELSAPFLYPRPTCPASMPDCLK